MAEALAALDQPRLALDTETRRLSEYLADPQASLCPHRGRISLLQLRGDQGPTYVFDVLVLEERGWNWEGMAEFLSNRLLVMANAKFDLKFLRRHVGRLWNVACVITLGKLLSNATGSKLGRARGHSLAALARDYLDVHLTGKGDLQADTWGVRPLSPEKIAYAVRDVAYLLPLYDILWPAVTAPLPRPGEEIGGWGMEQIARLEMWMTVVAAEIEYLGLPVSPTILHQLNHLTRARLRQVVLELGELLHLDVYPDPFDDNEVIVPSHTERVLNNPKALVELVARCTGISLPSAQKEVLQRLLELLESIGFEGGEQVEGPAFVNDEREVFRELETLEEAAVALGLKVVPLLLEYKRLVKQRGMDLSRYINPVTGRIHSNFQPLGAATGRAASSEPNLQNVTARTKLKGTRPSDNLWPRECPGPLVWIPDEQPPLPPEIELMLTSRHGFVAPPGKVIISCDFSSQETLVAAALSQDPVMMESFLQPPYMRADGTLTDTPGPDTYDNPDVDLHTLSAKAFCFPEIFEGRPKHEWVAIARDEEMIRLPGNARSYGKRVNYFLQYLGTALSLAQLCHVDKAVAESWVKGHRKLYARFHEWASEMAAIGAARGWIETTWGGRVRWVEEENAKAAGESPGRAAVNHLIQGLCADMGKAALVAVSKAFDGTDVELCNFVHDEIILVAPGRARLVEATEKKGVWSLRYEGDDQAIEVAERVKRIMEQIETQMLDEVLPGKAAYEIAPFWSH